MFRVEVKAFSETRWATNDLRFDTEEKAADYARGLYSRWLSCEVMSVVPDSTPKDQPYVEGQREAVCGG